MIQFCHDRETGFIHSKITYNFGFGVTEKTTEQKLAILPKGGRTIAVEVPTNEEFAALNPSLTMPVPVSIGIAVCSKKDLYCKATGRQFALGRMKEYNFFVTTEIPASTPDEPRILYLHNSELNMTIQFAKYPNAMKVYFEGVV